VSLTVAVNVTPLWPNNEDPESDETTAVELPALLTVCPPLSDPLLVMKFGFPL
jgi:hypothetical protein